MSVGPKEEVNRSVNVDSSIGRDTDFTFSYIGSDFKLDVVVISPSGVNYTADGPHSQNSVVSKKLTISIQNETEVNTYIYNVRLP